jgi:hypothetical protein
MDKPTIKTNLVPRNMIYGYELTAKERKEFDFMSEEEIDQADFVRYKGYVYYLGNFMRYGVEHKGIIWDGCEGDSYFSGTLIHICKDNPEQVIMARIYS